MADKIYDINGAKYVCAPFKLAQYQRLLKLIGKCQIGALLESAATLVNFFMGRAKPDDHVNIENVLVAFEDEGLLQEFFALCLVREGEKFKRENIEKIAIDMAEMDIEQSAEVFDHFLSRNGRSLKKALAILDRNKKLANLKSEMGTVWSQVKTILSDLSESSVTPSAMDNSAITSEPNGLQSELQSKNT